MERGWFLLKEKKEYFLFVMLLLCCVKYTHALYGTLDICLNDEDSYLMRGITNTVIPEYSPIYGWWYKFLSFFTNGNIELMFLNAKVLSVLYPLSVYVFLRKFGVNALSGFVLSVLVLIGMFNLPMYPKVVILMNVVLMAILFIAVVKIDILYRNSAILVILFLSYYLRPEFKYSFLVFFFYTIGYYLYRYNIDKKLPDFLPLVLSVLLFIFVSVFLGSPFSSEGSRPFDAFIQHFAKNYVEWNHLEINSWTDSDYIFGKVYGQSTGYMQALSENPGFFFMHLYTNLRNYIWCILHLIIPAFIPVHFATYSFAYALVFFSIVAGLIIYYRMNYTLELNRSAIFTRLKKHAYVLFISLLLLFPNMIAIFLIAPRYHYLAMEIPLFMTLLIVLSFIFTTPKNNSNGRRSDVIFFSLPVLLLILTPLPANNKFLTDGISDRPNLSLVKKLNSLDLKNERIISLNCKIINFTDYKVERSLSMQEKQENFNGFLSGNDINFICIDKSILENSKYINDAEWNTFLTDYSRFNFVKYPAEKDVYFLVKKEEDTGY